MDKIAVLIPCYNESRTIEKVVTDFKRVLPEATIYVYDNNSTDGTDELARAAPVRRCAMNTVREKATCCAGCSATSMQSAISSRTGMTPIPQSLQGRWRIRCSSAGVDMVVGDRLSSTYFTENKRPFHNFGNSLVRKSINTLFKNDIKDIMTGYRAFSYEFVKTFPVLSKGFEIETEMSIHAIDKNMFVENVVITYRDRPEGSVSKLDTYSDGFKVLKTIARLYRAYKPMGFFGIIALILAVIATAFFIPVMGTYLATGLVPDFPTLIVCGFTMLSAIQSLFVGVTLETMAQKNRQDFEMQLQRVTAEKKRLCGEKNDAD